MSILFCATERLYRLRLPFFQAKEACNRGWDKKKGNRHLWLYALIFYILAIDS